MNATKSDLVFVGTHGNCACSCTPQVFRSVWDRLCRQLFGAMPPDMASEDQLPDIDIWKGGIMRQGGDYPYTFTVISDEEDAPKPADVILYKGKYFVIGAVSTD